MERNVFIVDDELIISNSIKQFLEKNGYRGEIIKSGEDCINRIRSGDVPDLILMDINFGKDKMDGPAATDIIHAIHDVPVVLHSAYTDKETIGSTRDMTKYGYIHKVPGNEEVILATVETALKLYTTEKMLEQREALFRELSNHLQTVREEQNAAIAREIHDDLGQSMAALKMNVTMIEQALNADVQDKGREDIEKIVTEMKTILNGTVKKVRFLIKELRPPVLDTAGIIEALQYHIAEFQESFHIPVKWDVEGDEVELGKEKSLAAFRIVQEALTNCVRHGMPAGIEVVIKNCKERLVISVRDDGKGFVYTDSSIPSTYGLLGMKERAQQIGGAVEIESAPGEGTSVRVIIPHGEKP